MRQRARDAQKILKMLPQQQSRQRRRNSTNVLGKEWVSWSSNETAKNPVAPRWLPSLFIAPTQAGRQQDCFSYVLCPWLAYSGN